MGLVVPAARSRRAQRYRKYMAGLGPTAYWRFNDLASPPSDNSYDATVLARADTVAYWELGETSGTVAANSVSGGAYPGTIEGNPTLGVTGPLIGSADTAIDFDGTGDDVVIAYNAALNPASITVATWVWRDVDTGATERIVYSFAANKGYALSINASDALTFTVGTGASVATATSTATVPTGRWVHLAATNNGTTSFIYMDGVQVATASGAMVPNDSASTTWFSSGANYFSGKGAKCSIHNAALTASEVGSLFVKGRPVSDTQGNHAGGMIDAPTSATGAITGDTNACFDFDGSNDAVVVPYSAALNAATFSITGRIYVDGGAATDRFIIDSRSSGTVGYLLYLTAAGRIQFNLGNGASSVNAFNTEDIALGRWYHVAATYDGTYGRVYIEGALQATSTPVTLSQNTTNPTIIGARSHTSMLSHFNGKIDELTYHGSRVLTAAEILTAYNKGI